VRRQITPDELQHLYASIGRCVWNLQYVEDALTTLIAMKVEVKSPGRVPVKEAQDFLAKHRRNTLGTSMKIVRERSVVNSELLGRLSLLKEERDWIIHRSQQTHGDRLYTDDGRREMFSRLEAFEEEALSLQKLVLAEINTFLVGHGLDVAAAERMAAQNVGRLRGGGSDA
jgi:hypothetical protein